MDQQSEFHEEQIKIKSKPNQQNIEEGEVIEINEKIKKINLNKHNQKCEIQGSDSEWSWDSIEDLKGVDLKKLQAEEDGEQKMQPEHKQKQKIKVIYPQKPKNIEASTVKYVGCILQKVGDLLILQADLKQTYQVVDLDGWVCDEEKNFIGFVIDVFGKIENPFYAIKPQQGSEQQNSIGKRLYYIQGTKILNEDEVKSIQSKNKQQVQGQFDDSDEEQGQKEHSMQIPQIYKQKPNVENKRYRRNSFDNRPQGQRSRTRDNRNNNWVNMRQNNQQYLQNMYSMHYAQMMQFYSPNYQPNTPPPQFIPNYNPNNFNPNYPKYNPNQKK